jgi:hypothetical protein
MSANCYTKELSKEKETLIKIESYKRLKGLRHCQLKAFWKYLKNNNAVLAGVAINDFNVNNHSK